MDFSRHKSILKSTGIIPPIYLNIVFQLSPKNQILGWAICTKFHFLDDVNIKRITDIIKTGIKSGGFAVLPDSIKLRSTSEKFPIPEFLSKIKNGDRITLRPLLFPVYQKNFSLLPSSEELMSATANFSREI